MAFCIKCGSEILDKFGFCPKCGNKLVKDAPAPVKAEDTPSAKTSELQTETPTPTPAPAPAPVPAPAPAPAEAKKTARKADAGTAKKKKKWPLVLLIIVLVLALAGGGAFAFMKLWPFGGSSATALSEFSADEYYFLSGEEYTVTFTVKADGDADELELLCNGSKAGSLKDNGKGGDSAADDGIYTCAVTKTVDAAKSSVDEYQAKTGDLLSDKLRVHNVTVDEVELAAKDIERADEYIKELEASLDKNGTDEEKTESAKKIYNDVISYFDKLKEEGTVTEYSVDRNFIVAVFSGVNYIYEFELLENTQAGSSENIASSNENNTSAAVSDKKVVSVQPYASQLTSDVFDDAAEAVGDLYGYEFASNVDDGEVTVEFLKTLDEYDVIIWDGHGGNNKTFHSYVGTGEPDDNISKYPADSIGTRASLVTLRGGRIGVTPYFFEKYYEEGDFEDALIIMSCCHTADDDYLANVFLDRGAAAFFGYRNSVYTSYNRNMTGTLFEALTEWEDEDIGTKTVSAALEEAKAMHGASDPTKVETFWYNMLVFLGLTEEETPATLELRCSEGNEDFRLLVPSGTLAGKVCKASDRVTPVENARIEIYSGDELFETLESDAAGNYTVDLPVGSYRLVITAEGYIDFTCLANVTAFTCTYTETFLLIVGDESEIGCAEGIIRHALTGEVESEVTITVYEGWNNNAAPDEKATAVTDKNGEYSVELPLGNYTLKASKKGFVDCYFNIIVQSGVTDNQNGTITPSVSGDDFLITLTWGEYPSDLDSHVVGPLSDGSYFHVDYEYSENQDYDPVYEVLDPPVDKGKVVCRLDCDDIESFGPEHVTLHTTTTGAYYYYVNNFSEDGTLTHSNAHVTIHQGNNLIADFHVPTNQGNELYWNVFAIKNGEVIVMNTVTDEPDVEYAD